MTERPENLSVPYPTEKVKRHRSTFTPEQVKLLESEYKKQPYIGSNKRRELSDFLNLSDRAIKIWYQNRRSKERKDILSKRPDSDSKTSPNDKTSNAILRKMLSRSSDSESSSISGQDTSLNAEQNRTITSTPSKIPDMIPLENFRASDDGAQRRPSLFDNDYQQSFNNTEQTNFNQTTNFSPDPIQNPYKSSSTIANPLSSLHSTTSFYNETYQDANNLYPYDSRNYGRYPSYSSERDSYKASAEFSIELFKKYIKKDDCSNNKTESQSEDTTSPNLVEDLQTVTSSN